MTAESAPTVGGAATSSTWLPGWFEAWFPVILLAVVGGSLPLWGDSFFGIIATRVCVYWVLVSGLNLVVGFAGQLAIGWVSLLTIGAYVASALAAGRVTPEIPAYVALVIAAMFGAVFGFIAGLPALRLRTFYFAMTTLGLSTIVTQIALAWRSVTGGGVGIPGPSMPAPFDTPWGFYYFTLILALICTWMTCNIAASRFGRSLVAVRDAEVAAEAVGIYKPGLLMTVFLFSGALAGLAGGLFASLQSYITPDAFTFDLSVLFFIAILIGGRGSILGPMLGTAVLTVLPEFAAPLVQWSTFLYAFLLLVIVLLVPGGIADLLDFRNRRPLDQHREIRPRPELLAKVLERPQARERARAQGDRAGIRRRARRGWGRPAAHNRRGARSHRPERQRQDDDAERDLRLLRAATGIGEAGRHRLHTRGLVHACASQDRPHLPDAAHHRRSRPSSITS